MEYIKRRKITGYGAFQFFNYTFLILAAVSCIIPMIHLLAVSFSSSIAADAGKVTLWPVDFTTTSYELLLANRQFWTAMTISLQRVIIGGMINIFFIVMMAYPLSKPKHVFPQRKYYVWVLFFTMLFGGGMIPSYMVVRYTGLIDTIWALVLPDAVNAFNIILMLNFFRQLPQELDEAAFMDGATHWQILWKIYIPTSKPAIATVTLFCIVRHWNTWFDALIYMNRVEHYPLQTYLRFLVLSDDILSLIGGQEADALRQVSQATMRAAQIFVGALPILMVYPFLQKYFTKGIILGSVKG